MPAGSSSDVSVPLTRAMTEVTVSDVTVTAGGHGEREERFFKAGNSVWAAGSLAGSLGYTKVLGKSGGINYTFVTFVTFARFHQKDLPRPALLRCQC